MTENEGQPGLTNTDEEGANAINSFTPDTTGKSDGKITLTFYNNNLEVRGDFFPSLGDGSPITPEYISALLEDNNIRYGVQIDEINKALEDCSAGFIVKDVLVAKGDPPVNEIKEYMQLNPILEQGNLLSAKETDSVDHRARSPFIIVKKDMALAKIKRPKPGKEGKNVLGDTIGYETIQPEGVSGGENTRMHERFLLANIHGQLVITKKVVNVKHSLVISGAVGYGTGNIIFPGDVEIDGPVSDGFKIYSGGSITIKQTFDVTDAVTRNNLNVAGGIIGRGRAMVKVGGVLRTKFVENCQVACRKNIEVDLEIINSRIFTLETLVMGDKGRIVGGEIYALKGIRAGGIGRKSGKAARIHCGVDFTLEQEKEKNNGILRILSAKLSRLRELMEDPQADAEKKAKMETLHQRLVDEQKKAQAKISEILGKLNSYEDALVEVKGEIVPGTLIEICQAALFVTEPLKKVRIRLDRGNNKLITEKL